MTNREALRLETSLKAAALLRAEKPEARTVVFTHFPPFWNGKASESLIEILHKYDVTELYFGHIHGNYTVAPSFEYEGIKMSLVSADYLGFTPKIIL